MDDFQCSFCGKTRLAVRKLISGPRVFICNECVAQARQIMGSAPVPRAPEPPRRSQALELADGIRRRETMGFIDTATAQAQISEAYGVPFTDLEHIAIPEQVLRLIPREVAVKHHLVPIARAGNTLTVAMYDPNDAAVAAARNAARLDIDVTVADTNALVRLLELHYPRPFEEGPRCSFCSKPRSEVAAMAAGPSLQICEECIALCEDIVAALDEEEREPA